MEKTGLDEYLQQGIHGKKETKPEERRRFLSTIRERVVVALTQSQVRRNQVYEEVRTLMQNNRNAHLYLNGNIAYSDLSKYIEIAKQVNMKFTIVNNQEYNSDLGLVVAYDYAIDKEKIYIDDKPTFQIKEQKKGSKGLLSFFGKMFKGGK